MGRAFSTMVLVSVAFICGCGSIKGGAGATAGSVWDVDNLASIGGHETVVLGRPKVIETGGGPAVEFDGARDGLVVNALPLAEAEKFTLEIVFRPDADGLKEQRFLHLQEDGSESRILIETRLTGDNRWYLDTYIHTAKGSKALFQPANTHPVGRWYNAALVYDGRRMRHYVNGIKEMAAELNFEPLGSGKVSIGVRMNRVYWFKGGLVIFAASILCPDLEDAIVFPGGLYHFATFPDVVRVWFLDVNIFTSLTCQNRSRPVPVVWRRHNDRVDVLVVEYPAHLLDEFRLSLLHLGKKLCSLCHLSRVKVA